MRDYAELVKALRFAFEEQDCGECALAGTDRCTVGQTCRFKDAADAIEELLARDVVPTDFHERCLQLEIRKRIELEKQMPHWISVEERLPEQGERVLVSNGGFICESYLSQSGKWQRGGVDMFFMTPTHWTEMPRFEPPKEESKR